MVEVRLMTLLAIHNTLSFQMLLTYVDIHVLSVLQRTMLPLLEHSKLANHV